MKTKAQIGFAVTVKLICTFIFATQIVQFLYFLNPKFPASSHLLYVYSSVCVGPTCFENHTAGFLMTRLNRAYRDLPFFPGAPLPCLYLFLIADMEISSSSSSSSSPSRYPALRPLAWARSRTRRFRLSRLVVALNLSSSF